MKVQLMCHWEDFSFKFVMNYQRIPVRGLLHFEVILATSPIHVVSTL